MKKILAYLIILITIVTLYGCGDPNYKTPEQIGQMKNETIMEALKAKDKEKLKKVLAKAMQNQENIDEEIDNLMNFIDGNIVSYDDIGIASPGRGSSDEQGLIYRVYDGETENIITDTGKKYKLHYATYYVNRNHQDYVGVIQIKLCDTEIYTEENDYPQNGMCGIYLKEDDDEE